MDAKTLSWLDLGILANNVNLGREVPDSKPVVSITWTFKHGRRLHRIARIFAAPWPLPLHCGSRSSPTRCWRRKRPRNEKPRNSKPRPLSSKPRPPPNVMPQKSG